MLRAGLDWASATHAVCVVDAEGQRVLQAAVPHTAEGLARMLRRLAGLAPPSQLPIAIERPTGLLVDALVHAGHPVVPIHPNVLKASRSRYSAAGGKSDPRDAYILADLLRTDGHRFRTLEPQSDPLRALRALVRSRDDLVAQRVALSNQLTALLESFWPGAATLFANPTRFPTEEQLAAEAGVAPVTYTSGRHRGVVFRTACNKRLRKAITTFAGNSRRESKWADRIYAEARARGCRHPHAVRILARAWVRVLWKAWSDGLAYDPSKHNAAARLEAAC